MERGFYACQLCPDQQLFELSVLPCAQELDGISAVLLSRIENIRAAVWAVAAVAVVKGVAIVVER